MVIFFLENASNIFLCGTLLSFEKRSVAIIANSVNAS